MPKTKRAINIILTETLYPSLREAGFSAEFDETSRFLFVSKEDSLYVLSSEGDATDAWKIVRNYNLPNATQIIIGAPLQTLTGQRLDRGVVGYGFWETVGIAAGLPSTWKADQDLLAKHILAPLLQASVKPVKMAGSTQQSDAREPDYFDDASKWMTNWFEKDVNVTDRGVVLIQAEAGKGKSTLLANRIHAEPQSSPPFIFIPLRRLPRSMGVSWSDIASIIGVRGESVERLAECVRMGIVRLALDGLDEIGGRYDPEMLDDLVISLVEKICSPTSKVLMAGRRTQALRLTDRVDAVLSLELPAAGTQQLGAYIDGAISSALATWPETAINLPSDMQKRFGVTEASLEVSTVAQTEQLRAWVQAVFEDYGKDRSLFFVQGLAVLGRTYQAEGNKPVYIEGGGVQFRPSLLDVCLAAAAVACQREQSKAEDLAHSRYTLEGQLRSLSAMAVLAASPETSYLPTPNRLVASIFNLDTVNEPEIFNAIVRQTLKHALLFASGPDDAIRVGDWRPGFLSPWTRDALLVWSLVMQSVPLAPFDNPDRLAAEVSLANDARHAFETLLPDLEDISIQQRILESFQSNEVHPNRSANALTFRVALDPLGEGKLPIPPIPPLTDLSERMFIGSHFGSEFAPDNAIFDGTEFESCELSQVVFLQCDLRGVTFRDSTFTHVRFDNCHGPTTFINCMFVCLTINEVKGVNSPILTFSDCAFDTDSRITIDKYPYTVDKSISAPPLSFFSCLIQGDISGD